MAYEILLLFFGNGIVRSDVMNNIIQSLMTCTLIIKQVLPKYKDSYIFRHSKFVNCLTWLKVDVLPYFDFQTSNFLGFVNNCPGSSHVQLFQFIFFFFFFLAFLVTIPVIISINTYVRYRYSTISKGIDTMLHHYFELKHFIP